MTGQKKLGERVDFRRLISFDLDGTLVDPGFNEWIWSHGIPELYATAHGTDFQTAKQYVTGEYDRVGEERIEWYDIGYWFKSLGLGGSPRELMERFKHKIRLYPEVPQVLDNLSKKYDLIVTSNAARDFLEMELESTKVDRYFRRTFSATSDFKQVKKTPEFYQGVCSLMGLTPGKVIHVGDHWEFDYLTPSKVGMYCLFIDRQGHSQGKFVARDLLDVERIIG